MAWSAKRQTTGSSAAAMQVDEEDGQAAPADHSAVCTLPYWYFSAVFPLTLPLVLLLLRLFS